jgi:tetratricopeptide (TPR) repeat protein
MATVSLQMIIKDEDVRLTVGNAIEYFDEINLTVSNHRTALQLEEFFKKQKTVNVKFRRWNNRFDDARNANFAMCHSDYAFWIDADDQFDFSTVPNIVALAEEHNLDAVFLPYNYAQNEDGVCVTKQYRERLLKMSSGFTWAGWVHETPIWPTTKYRSHILDHPVVTHITDKDHNQRSIERNHAILAEAYEATDDPRYIYYFGMSLFTKGEYAKSIAVLSEYLKVGGSVEDIYRALNVISESAYHLGKHDVALEYASKCTVLKPEYPQGYWLLAQYEADQKNWEQALEWVRVSLTKPDPKTLSVWDPSARERAVLIGAQADFMLGNYNKALAWLRKIPNNKESIELMEGFTEEADAETFVNLLPKIRKYFYNDESLFEALCHDMQYDQRLQNFRFQVRQPVKWPKNSIAILCGEGYEEWGPHTLDKGMGGSEEAVIYLSRELSKLGYDVTVFTEVPHRMLDTTPEPKEYSVKYRPWREVDVRDEFDIFIGWRAPQFLETVNARIKLADIHDIIPASIVKPYDDVTYMFKSEYHRDLYEDLPKEKSRVIGNGIAKEQFHEDTK